MKPKIQIPPARDRKLKRTAKRIVNSLISRGWVTLGAFQLADVATNLVLDELRRAEARRKP